jgi:F-type H+-transporting ATPase subunit a
MAAEKEGIDIIHHLVDSGPWVSLDLGFIDISITKHVVMMWFSAVICFLLFTYIGRQRSLVPKGIRNFFEMILLYLRDEVVYANMGPKNGEKFLPYIWTIFFFILFCNLLGLVPMGATATGNIAVTASLAICTFVVIHVSGMVHYGPLKYLKIAFLVGPWPLWPLMMVVEGLGHLVKPFALTIRLFANMISGHILIMVIFGFIFMFTGLVGAAVTGVTVIGAMAIYLLEVMVAFIQAFIFALLSTVFINMAMHAEH